MVNLYTPYSKSTPSNSISYSLLFNIYNSSSNYYFLSIISLFIYYYYRSNYTLTIGFSSLYSTIKLRLDFSLIFKSNLVYKKLSYFLIIGSITILNIYS